MTIRTNLKAGRKAGAEQQETNHNETLQVRTALKAGKVVRNHNEVLRVRSAIKAGKITRNHNEALQVRSALKAGDAGRLAQNHSEALRREPDRPVISMRREPRTTGRKEDRLELLVVRAGLRAGRVSRRFAR